MLDDATKGHWRSSSAPSARQWPWRLLGTLFGSAACVVGLYSILGAGEELPALERERALGFGVAAIVVGLVAVGGSLAGDAYALWHCRPRRWRLFRAPR